MNVGRYRFKTEAELFADYGEAWKKKGSIFLPVMSYLFGQELTEEDALQWEIAILKYNPKDPRTVEGFFLEGKYEAVTAPKGIHIEWGIDQTALVEIKDE